METSHTASIHSQDENVPNEISLEDIRPHPKAGARKSTRRAGGKKRATAIVTDTPEKDRLSAEKEATLARKTPKPKRKILQDKDLVTAKVRRVSTRKSAKSTVQLQESQDNSNFLCLICQENWSDSRVGEKWVQCINCKQWCHVQCVAANFKLCDDCS